MKQSSKTIQNAALRGVFPPPDTLEAFIVQSNQMMTYPDKGAPHYPSFKTACEALRRAFIAQDMQVFRASWEEINGIRKEAHRQYR